jgi:hypothetical protein
VTDDDVTIVWLWAMIGVLAGLLIAALGDVQRLHGAAMRAWVEAHTLRQQLREERRMLIATRDAMMCKLCSISEKSDELEELAHALAQLAPLQEIRDEQSELGRLRKVTQ